MSAASFSLLRANVDPARPLRRGSRNGVLEQYIVNAAGTIPDKEDKMRAQLKWVVGLNTFEICVTNADGTHLVQLTDNARFEGTRDVVSRWAESRIPEPGGNKSHSALECRNGAGQVVVAS